MNLFLILLAVLVPLLLLIVFWRSPRMAASRREYIHNRVTGLVEKHDLIGADLFITQCEWMHLIGVEEAQRLRDEFRLESLP